MDTVRCAACMMLVFSRLSGISRAGVFFKSCPKGYVPALSVAGIAVEYIRSVP